MKRLTIFAIISILLVPGMLLAQDLTGVISGTVTDQQGALIPGAQVTATHLGTNTVYKATTRTLGKFTIPSVRLGLYNVAVESTGFRRAVVLGVKVEVGGTATVSVRLEVGVVTETVEVTADISQVLINTTDAELSTVVDERRVLDLPLNGRNATHLTFLQAGVWYERNPDGPGDKLLVHGQRHRSINITLDGIDTQDNLNRASSIMIDQPLLALAAENIQEFRVITGISSAEFSRGGVQISAVTRSGTNDWHGSVFWFHRNDIFNANNFFNNSTGVEVPKLVRNQFGGRIGGPIIRDKTFFFFGYQNTRESKGIAVNRTVYTAEARQGLFRYLDNVLTTPEAVALNPTLIRSVNLLECGAAIQAALGRDCVDQRFDAANPTSLDPFISGSVFAGIPFPNNFDVGDGLNTGGFRFNARSKTFEHLPSFRLDHSFNDKHRFSGTANYIDRNIDGDFINNREPRFPAFGPLGARLTHSKGFSASLSSNFTPSMINEFRFGVLAGENAFIRKQPFPTEFHLDFFNITDAYNPGGRASVRDNETWHVRDSFTWVKGNHQFKFGGEWRHRWLHNYSFFEVLKLGEIDFDRNDAPSAFSESNLRLLSGGTDIETTDIRRGRQMINELVGFIGQVEVRYNAESIDSGFVTGAPDRRLWRTREMDLFFQDTWAVNSQLTLNLGVRWEFATPPIETRGLTLIPEGGGAAVFGISGADGFFNPGVLNGRPCPELTSGLAPTTANVTTLILNCAVPYIPGGSNNGVPLWDTDYGNFGPVLGIAYDPWGDGKTSVRAGFRISYMQDHFAITHSNLDDNEGLRVDQDCEPNDGIPCLNDYFLLRDIDPSLPPIAAQPVFQIPAVRTILDSTSQDMRTFADDLDTPYYVEWTLGVQREIFANTVLEVRYVGNHGVKLRRVADFNQANIFALDPITGQTFLEAFIIAQSNLACNVANGAGNDFSSTSAGTAAGCITANPLMDALIANDSSRLDSRSRLIDALEFNEPGEFVYRLTQRETSRPSSGQSRIRGGSFWGQVLSGRFPANFFHANPFIHSSRAMVNDSWSKYHAMEVELRRRFSQGLTLQVNYTFQRALADYDGDSNTLLNDVRPSSILFRDFNTREIMPRHLFKANWLYELPIGSARRFDVGEGVASKILTGWQVGGIINRRSGRPLSISSGIGAFHRSAISDDNTVNLTQAMSRSQLRALTGRQNIGGGIFWFDPCLSGNIGGTCATSSGISGLFTIPNSGELGQLQHTPIFGPSRFEVDLNFNKRTQVTEDLTLEFRWEIFNVFNTVNFHIPNTNFFSTSFGQILRTVGGPRLMQFALKVNF